MGPVSQSDLLRLLGANSINLDTLVWRPSWIEWRTLIDAEEIQGPVLQILREQQRRPHSLPPVASAAKSGIPAWQENRWKDLPRRFRMAVLALVERRNTRKIIQWVGGVGFLVAVAVIAFLALESGVKSNDPNANNAAWPAAAERFASTQASTNWVKVSETAEMTYFLDPASVRKKGYLRIIRALFDLKTPGASGDRSAQSLMEYDCPGQRHRTLAHNVYSGQMAKGRVLASDNTPDVQWQNLPSGNVILNFVCSL